MVCADARDIDDLGRPRATTLANPQIHSSAREGAEVARQAEVQRLLLIHLPPFAPALDELIRAARSADAVQTLSAADGAEGSALLS